MKRLKIFTCMGKRRLDFTHQTPANHKLFKFFLSPYESVSRLFFIALNMDLLPAWELKFHHMRILVCVNSRYGLCWEKFIEGERIYKNVKFFIHACYWRCLIIDFQNFVNYEFQHSRRTAQVLLGFEAISITRGFRYCLFGFTTL